MGHDFGEVSVFPPDRPASSSTEEPTGGIRSISKHHRHAFSAVVRRASPPSQSDSTGENEHAAAGDLGAPPAPAAAARPERPPAEPEDGETVRFAGIPGIDVPAQADAISTTLTYDPSINPVPPPAAPGKFGETNTRIEVNRSSGRPDGRGTFLVELVVDNVITYWVAGGTRKNIASDADPNITQTNYPMVVSDLTPSPRAIRTGGLDLLKNQSPRKDFWARDLTIDHEIFHADENEKFGRDAALAARDWLNGQTARNLDDVEALVGRVPPMISRRLAVAMAPPAVEQRAYDDGAPAYAARARAIKAKGDARGYVPAAPTP